METPPYNMVTAPGASFPERRTHVRYWIVAFLFLLTSVNYADRATLSIVGPQLSKELKLDAAAMGWVFSAFAWAYALCQIPGGWLLDRFGSKQIYFWSIALWSLFTVLQGCVGSLGSATAVTTLFALRFLLGVAESPSFPANARIVAAWFPTAERGLASAIFNSAQYFATVAFAPLMGWITHAFGWPPVFWSMGALGLACAALWPRLIHGPREHPWINTAEIDHIERGGGLVDLDRKGPAVRWAMLGQLLGNRMLVGIYVGQYCITTLTWFFLTWFPLYLVQQRGMSILQAGFMASLPALCGFIGGVTGGFVSDRLLRRGVSLTTARKLPIILGMLLSMTIVACNYVDAHWAVILFMSLAFFGKGIGALGWAVTADVSPKEITGLNGGLFNMFGNLAGVTTPIVIGYIVKDTGQFDGALVYVGAHGLLAIVSYVLIVGEIKRVELKPS
ncbi:MAG TPA: MFS transporter [Candidatus Didemnitutus sp.]|nr:MFS transporter [Candidatus Didemnitutus sp.]